MNLSGALSKDNVQYCEYCGEGQHGPRSDVQESQIFGGA